MNLRVERIEYNSNDKNLLHLWNRLLNKSSSPEKIYQTPEYFQFLLDIPFSHKSALLLALYNSENGIEGIIPFRLVKQNFDLKITDNLCLASTINTAQLLGSIPFSTIDNSLLTAVIKKIFELFPDVEGINMAALPYGSAFETQVSSFAKNNSYLLHVLNGWRDCHLIPLPDSFEAYLSRYNGKKRFNLRRQIRQLHEHSDNTLQLHRICDAEQVAIYVSTWKQLAPPELATHLLSNTALKMLAEKGLLHGYVLTIKGTPCGGIYATQAAGTLHIHNIIYAKELARLSVGACILYMAIEDLIEQGQLKVIDLGYSNPAHSEQASNVVEVRGNTLILRKTWRNRALCHAQNLYLAILPVIKRFMKNYMMGSRETRKTAR